MPYLESTDNLEALLTEGGREALARMILGELAFQLTSFQVGRGGYQTANPVRIETVDPASTALVDPVGGSRSFVDIEQPVGLNVVAPVCRLDPSVPDVEFGLGELGIFATYTDHGTPGLIGTDFLFALAHFPLISKVPLHTFVWRVNIVL